MAQKTPRPARRHAKVDRSRVELGEGHYIELTIAVDLFTLSEGDRAFVFGIIDQFNAWRRDRDRETTQVPGDA